MNETVKLKLLFYFFIFHNYFELQENMLFQMSTLKCTSDSVSIYMKSEIFIVNLKIKIQT